MKRSLSQMVALALFACASLNTFGQSAAGQVDFAQVIDPAKGGQCVDVHVGRDLISLVARFLEKEQPEAAKLLRSVHSLQVNVVGLTEENRDATVKRVQEFRAQLDKQGWQRIVAVQDKRGQDIGIFVKTRDDEAMEGIVLTVLDKKAQAVLINIAGNIRPEQVAAVGEALHIEELKKVGAALKKE